MTKRAAVWEDQELMNGFALSQAYFAGCFSGDAKESIGTPAKLDKPFEVRLDSYLDQASGHNP